MMDANALVLNVQSNKLCRGSNGEGNVDRLSGLPEAIISHILSFLPTKEAVKTCALSTKWIYMWTIVTTLDLEDDWVVNRKERFINFVDRVLLLGNPVIHNFHLSLSKGFDTSRVHSWISAVIRRGVQKLRIQYHYADSFVFPRCLYTSVSLIELELMVPCTFKVPTSICLSSLKILQVSQVTFLNESYPRSSELNFSFPCLQTLRLNGCKWQNVKVVDIAAPSLISFEIIDFDHYWVPDPMKSFVINIHASSIIEFECSGKSIVDFNIDSPSSITRATFHLFVDDREQKLKMGLRTCTLLKKFSSLKYLLLSGETIVVLASLEDLQNRLPTINNLIQLTISWRTPGLRRALITLLQSLPVLESLILAWESATGFDDEVVPLCFQTHLKLVKFLYFDGTESGLEFAKFLLKNATVLEEMTIIAGATLKYQSVNEIQAVKEKMLAFPRTSDHASISFT